MRTKEQLKAEREAKRRPNAANRGKPFEATLDALHRGYLARGEAFVIKTSAPVRVIRHLAGGRFEGFFEATGAPDYFAIASGTAIVFDAKHHADRLPFDAIPKHQAEALDAAERAGAVAGIVADLPDMGGGWWLPWSALGPRWWAWRTTTGRAAPGTASLGLMNLRAIGVRLEGHDWLDGFRADRAARMAA